MVKMPNVLSPDSDHLQLIREIERAIGEGNYELSEYQANFVEDMKRRELPLTPQQDNFLETLWKRATGQY